MTSVDEWCSVMIFLYSVTSTRWSFDKSIVVLQTTNLWLCCLIILKANFTTDSRLKILPRRKRREKIQSNSIHSVCSLPLSFLLPYFSFLFSSLSIRSSSCIYWVTFVATILFKSTGLHRRNKSRRKIEPGGEGERIQRTYRKLRSLSLCSFLVSSLSKCMRKNH